MGPATPTELPVLGNVPGAAFEPRDAASLFKEHATFVARFLVRLGVRHADVPDLVQEVFLVVHRSGGYSPGPAKPTTWLAAIAFRVGMAARRAWRKQMHEFDEDLVVSYPSSAASPLERTQAMQSLCRVQHAIDALDPDHRAAFILFELEGDSCEAIAQAFGIPVGTVYSRLNTARKIFRAAYDKLEARPNVLRKTSQEAP